MARNFALDRSRRRVRRAQITDDEIRHEPSPRETLEIAFFDGLSYPEIAAGENVALGTVMSRASRALAALSVALDGTFDGEEGREDPSES